MPVVDYSDQPEWQLKRGWRARFLSTEAMEFVYYDVDDEAELLHGVHPGREEVWHVLEDRLTLTIEGVDHELGSGMAGVVPPDTPHSARPLGHVRALVVEASVRGRGG